MGQLVAIRDKKEPEDLFVQYYDLLCSGLKNVPRYTNNINVLQHGLGYFSKRVTNEEKAYCLRLIDRYKDGHATLAEPRDLLRSWVIRFQEPHLMDQTFFAPYPFELEVLPDDSTDRGRDVWKTRKPSTVPPNRGDAIKR
jgi:uncharacterized protein YbgA (DUF1722 family)